MDLNEQPTTTIVGASDARREIQHDIAAQVKGLFKQDGTFPLWSATEKLQRLVEEALKSPAFQADRQAHTSDHPLLRLRAEFADGIGSMFLAMAAKGPRGGDIKVNLAGLRDMVHHFSGPSRRSQADLSYPETVRQAWENVPLHIDAWVAANAANIKPEMRQALHEAVADYQEALGPVRDCMDFVNEAFKAIDAIGSPPNVGIATPMQGAGR